MLIHRNHRGWVPACLLISSCTWCIALLSVQRRFFYALVLWDVVKLHAAQLQLITFSVLLTEVIACLPRASFTLPARNILAKWEIVFEKHLLFCFCFLIELLDIRAEEIQNNFKWSVAFENIYIFLIYHHVWISSVAQKPLCLRFNYYLSFTVTLHLNTQTEVYFCMFFLCC